MNNAKTYWKSIRKLQYLMNPQLQIPCVRTSIKNAGNAGKTQSNRSILPIQAARPSALLSQSIVEIEFVVQWGTLNFAFLLFTTLSPILNTRSISSAGYHYAERISCKTIETWKLQSVVSAPLENVSAPGADPGGRLGRSTPWKPTKVTLFTIILYNLKSSSCNIGQFCRPLFWHSSVVKFTSLSYIAKLLWDLTTKYCWNRPA